MINFAEHQTSISLTDDINKFSIASNKSWMQAETLFFRPPSNNFDIDKAFT